MSYSTARRPAETQSLETGFPFAIVIGAVLALLGFAMGVVAVTVKNDPRLLAVGGLVFAVGMLRLTTAFARGRRERRVYLANPNDPRWHGGAGIRQLAGRSCRACDERIVIGVEARSCKKCGAPVHIDCAPLHRAQEHPRQPKAMA